MRNPTKPLIVLLFALLAGFVFLRDAERWPSLAQVSGRPTPTPSNTASNSNNKTNTNLASNTNVASNTNANAKPTATVTPSTAGKTIPKSFTLGKDSQSEHGEV